MRDLHGPRGGRILKLGLDDAFNPAAVQPMCHCTTHSHDEVRRLIRAKGLKTIPAVMQELEWSTSRGCAKCRPALNYYLVCDWPDDYADDYQSRFVNERVHAIDAGGRLSEALLVAPPRRCATKAASSAPA